MIVWACRGGGWWKVIIRWLIVIVWLFLWVFVIINCFVYEMLVILWLPAWCMRMLLVLLWVISIGVIVRVFRLAMFLTKIDFNIIKLINDTMIRIRFWFNGLLINPFSLTQRLSTHCGMKLLKRRWWILHVIILKFLCICF